MVMDNLHHNFYATDIFQIGELLATWCQGKLNVALYHYFWRRDGFGSCANASDWGSGL